MVNRTKLVNTSLADLEAIGFIFRVLENEWFFVAPNGVPSVKTYISLYEAVVAANSSRKKKS
jgi:hypothetical protein